MAASDPTTRARNASIAVRARLAGLTPDERRDMTAKARAALHAADLAKIDGWARRAGRYPLPDAEREARAAGLRRKRALAASRASLLARQRRAAIEAEQARERAADRDAARGVGINLSLAQVAARR